MPLLQRIGDVATADRNPQGRGHRTFRARSLGFTLVELMVTVSVLAVILGLAAPSFGALLASNRTSTVTNDLIGSLNLARSEAVRRAQPATLAASGSGASGYSSGWTVFADADGDGAPQSASNDADGRTLRQAGPFSATTTITRVTRSASPAPYTYTTSTGGNLAYLVFTARGANQSATDAFFKVCAAANASVPARVVRVNVVGKVSLDSTSATCP